MNQTNHYHQQLLASYTGKLLREHFGKGPESVLVSIGGPFISIYLRNFLTPPERVLIQQNHIKMVHQMREKLMQIVIPELTEYIDSILGIRPTETYYDWALWNQSGMITAICPNGFDSAELFESFPGKTELEEGLIRFSEETHKAPERLYSCELNNRMLLFIREGKPSAVENELIRLGQGELLRSVKRNLEKTCLEDDPLFEENLKRRVLDIFVDWNDALDKSVILLVTSLPVK